MERGAAHRGVGIVLALAVLHPAEHVAVAIKHAAEDQLAIGVVKMAVGRKRGPGAAAKGKAKRKNQQPQNQKTRKDQAQKRPLFNFLHDTPPPSVSIAKLALWRVSAAFRKASMPHADIIDEPPLETNGNVTPVSGSRSTEPKTFKHV